MSGRGASAVMPFALAALVATRAAAHPGPAVPPTFAPGACITVVDTRETQLLELKYDVMIDDNVFGEGEIQLPDAKTHQFFSFSGVVSKNTSADGYQLYPFDAGVQQPLALPLWLDQADVNRAADAAGPADMTGFTASQVDAGDVLANRPDLSGQLRALAGDSVRVPITRRQAEKGVQWDLRALAPGLYSVVAYVFSPPYNDWAPRAGIFKLVDGHTAAPAAVLEPIDTTLFAGQGRRVRGCVDAPAGSTLSAWVRAEDQPDGSWEPWLEREPLSAIGRDGTFELCLVNREPGRSGVLRVRVEVTAPDGQRSAAYSPDTLLAVGTPAGCSASEDTCCPASAPPGDAGTDPVPVTPADAGAPEADAALQPDEPREGGALPEAAALQPSAGPDSARREGSGGCAVRAGETAGSGWLVPALVAALAWWRRSSRRCRSWRLERERGVGV